MITPSAAPSVGVVSRGVPAPDPVAGGPADDGVDAEERVHVSLRGSFAHSASRSC